MTTADRAADRPADPRTDRRTDPAARASGQSCPWCRGTAGYRDLTAAESGRLLPRLLVQSLVLGASDALRRPHLWASALVGASGAEVACRDCARVVRVCPRCDTVTRWLSAALETCARCGTVFR